MILVPLLVWVALFAVAIIEATTTNSGEHKKSAEIIAALLGLVGTTGVALLAYDRQSLLDLSLAVVLTVALLGSSFLDWQWWRTEGIKGQPKAVAYLRPTSVYGGVTILAFYGLMSFFRGAPLP